MESDHESSVLDDAQKIIEGARQTEYGPPSESFGRIAQMWSAYLGIHIGVHDVALMMVLLKTSRARNGVLATGQPQRDSLVDIAGYAGCSDLCRDQSHK